MFKGHDIQFLVELFEKQNAKIYHACQLKDFRSYLELGGVPSRQLLENANLPFTNFVSDNNDRRNNDWDKVFVNLSDFGSFFGSGSIAVPNVYGPILFQLSPNSLHEAEDVAVCLKSAGSKGFVRENESLKSISDVERLFEKEGQQQIKSASKLKTEFDLYNKPSSPEISCSVKEERLSLEYVELIRIDQYAFQDRSLTDFAKEIVSNSNWTFKIYERNYCPTFTREIVDILIEKDRPVTLLECINDDNRSQRFRNWASAIMERDHLRYQFDNFIRYLFVGTVSDIKNS